MKRIAFSLVLLSATAAVAQEPQTGFPPYSSIQRNGFDSVNESNLNVNFSIPIVSRAGRGLDLNFSLVYDSSIWVRNGNAWSRIVDQNVQTTWGWKGDAPFGSVSNRSQTFYCFDGLGYINGAAVQLYDFKYKDIAGTTHPFSFSYFATTCGGYGGGSTSGVATDGSGYHLSAPLNQGRVITAPSGRKNETTASDTNGNYISRIVDSSTLTRYVDTLNRDVVKVIRDGAGKITEYQVLDQDGAYTTLRYVISYVPKSIKTNFGCAGVTEYTGAADLISSTGRLCRICLWRHEQRYQLHGCNRRLVDADRERQDERHLLHLYVGVHADEDQQHNVGYEDSGPSAARRRRPERDGGEIC